MTSPKTRPRPALLLDRDGVINQDSGYVHTIEAFEFLPGIFELVRHATQSGYPVVIVTNQSGIGQGLYDEAAFQQLTRWMAERFRETGGEIAGVYHCPTHPERGLGAYRRESIDRKPNPGLFLRARDELGLDLGRSVLVGDRRTDLQAGRRAGVGICLLYAPAGETCPEANAVIADLRDAERYLPAIGEAGG